MRYLVDGMNVIGSRPDGWWRDRPKARRSLVGDVAGLVPAHEVTVVFDGRPDAGEADAAASLGIRLEFAAGGPNAADHAIVALVEADVAPQTLVVVTSDAALAGRVQAAGATVLGARRFTEQLGRAR